MITGLLYLVLYLFLVGLVFAVIYWILGQFAIPEPINKIIRILLVIIAVIIIITLILQWIPGLNLGGPSYPRRLP